MLGTNQLTRQLSNKNHGRSTYQTWNAIWIQLSLLGAYLRVSLSREEHFLMVWPALPRMGRITSDVVTCMSVMQFIRVGHIATFKLFEVIIWAIFLSVFIDLVLLNVSIDFNLIWHSFHTFTPRWIEMVLLIWHNSEVIRRTRANFSLKRSKEDGHFLLKRSKVSVKVK